jgi:GGDEF domain-containing protein
MKRIIDKIKCHNKTADHKLSISLGCAVKTNPKTDLEEILSKADAMMYRQKKDKNL